MLWLEMKMKRSYPLQEIYLEYKNKISIAHLDLKDTIKNYLKL